MDILTSLPIFFETSSALSVTTASAARGGGRTAFLLDSSVAVQAIVKGRSSARVFRNIFLCLFGFLCFPSSSICPDSAALAIKSDHPLC